MTSPEQPLPLPDAPAPVTARARAAQARKGKRPKPPDIPAPDAPVARVVVDLPLPHLDRPFDYLVTEKQHEQVVPGCRVRVRFSGQLVDGFVLERVDSSDHQGRLAPLARAVSAEPVLSPEIAHLARSVADRYAGTLSDVLRLAIPPRHAAAEAQPAAVAVSAGTPREPTAAREWDRYVGGRQFLERLMAREGPRAIWSALPGPAWGTAIAQAIESTVRGGRGALVVVPDVRDVARVTAAVDDVLGPSRHIVLTADLGPRERYRRWLSVRRGQASVVIGTRAAAFAPVVDLGLVVLWDDGDDLHAELRAPYPHMREVLALRAHEQGVGLLIGGVARTAEGASLVASGFAKSVVAPRATVRAAAPRVRATDDATRGDDPAARSRLPHAAWQTARDALRRGPVLVQVPRGGYVPAAACARCHSRARCPNCQGPMSLRKDNGAPTCRWCSHVAVDWHCAECGDTRLRAYVVGAGRTAEELGRAFPAVPVVTSGGGSVLAEVPAKPALVVATPGAEPVAAGGYSAALLLDAWALLGRADLRAAEETLRRWLMAAALVQPATTGGEVVVVADAALRPVQALVRWDPVGHAGRELADRVAVGLPPARRVAELTGQPEAVEDLLHRVRLPASASIVGPTPVVVEPGGSRAGQVRALVRVPRDVGLAMARALREAAGERSARKAANPVTVRIDPNPLV